MQPSQYPQQQYQQPQYQQQPYPPQQQYPQQQYVPQQNYTVPQQPMQVSMAQGQTRCRFCGCVPAAEVTFRGHRGMVLIMQFLSASGPFCRDCGLATFRSMTAKTLIQGWYGYASLMITPITVLINLARRGQVANLPAPQLVPDGMCRTPMDPGPPLFARPSAVIGLALPFLVIGGCILYLSITAA